MDKERHVSHKPFHHILSRPSVYILPKGKARQKCHHQHTGSITATALQPSDGIFTDQMEAGHLRRLSTTKGLPMA
jgi:hypothetical protein